MNPFVGLWSKKRLLKKGRLTSCLILIALVMTPLVCALIFSDSMMEGITGKYIHLSDGHLQLNYYEGGRELSEFNIADYKEMLYSADEVTSGYALMYSSTATCSLIVKGVGIGYFNEKRLSQITFEISDNPTASNLKGIAISRATAKALNVGLGDRVALMIVPDDADKALRPVLLRITSIFYTGYDQLDRLLSFIDIDYAKTLYSSKSSSSVELLVQNDYTEKLDSVIASIGDDYDISKWNEHNISVYENFVTSRQMIFVILLLVVIVAAFYTASVAQQMIQDDIQDIAIAKLIGSSDAVVRKSAFLSVYTVTCLGMLLGIALGLIIGCSLGPALTGLSSLGIQSLSFYLLDFDITIPWISILIISVCLLAISFISIRFSLRKTKAITPIRLFTSF
ncbi:MAG: ABC transporter permease [Sphaerochaeta sp.]